MENEKIFGLMLDTETTNTLVNDDGTLDMRDVLPYDLGFMVIDTEGNIYEKHSYIIKDIFCDEFALTCSAFYADKIPQYIRDFAKGQRIIKTAFECKQIIYKLFKQYGLTFVAAHNARFDYRACNNLQRWTTKSKYRYFFPYNLEVWDTMKMAQDVICKMPQYQQFCLDNGYITKNNQVRKTAEILYRFISGDNDFIESHTGLEDCEIEIEILKYCFNQNISTMRKKLFEKKY